MRIIAGSKKGLRLTAGRGRAVRPTADRVKATVFNLLGSRMAGATVLDLFAGSGSLGIEALSRGALRAVFVEQARSAVRVLRANLARAGFEERAQVWACSTEVALARLGAEGAQFELIFADPPYGQGLALATLERVEELNLLTREGCLVLEHETRALLPEAGQRLTQTRRRTMGETTVSLYAYE